MENTTGADLRFLVILSYFSFDGYFFSVWLVFNNQNLISNTYLICINEMKRKNENEKLIINFFDENLI